MYVCKRMEGGVYMYKHVHMYQHPSLVPRPFPPPVFDRLQYANTEGEGLGDLVMCGYVGWTEGRHTGGGAR